MQPANQRLLKLHEQALGFFLAFVEANNRPPTREEFVAGVPRPPVRTKLSSRQEEAVRFIARYTEINRRPPTMSELAAAVCGSGRTNPHYLVQPLRDKGYVALPDVKMSRTLSLTPKGAAWARRNRIEVTAPLPIETLIKSA